MATRRWKIKPRGGPVTIMTPGGEIIATTDANGEFEADYPFEDDPRYSYVTPAEAKTRRKDAANSEQNLEA